MGHTFHEGFSLRLEFLAHLLRGLESGRVPLVPFLAVRILPRHIPLIQVARDERNRSRLSKLYTACNMRGGILLLAITLIVVNIATVPPFFVFPSGYGGWKLPTYLVLFITAYVMASNPRFEESIEKNKVPTLLLGILTSLSIIALLAISLSDPSAMSRYYVLVSTIWALNGWCWVAAILGFGGKHHFASTINSQDLK